MLSLVLSELVLICNFFEETYFCYLYADLVACFYEIHLRFLTSHTYFHLDDCDKPYQSSTQEMDDGADMRFRNSRTTLSHLLYRDCGEKKRIFLAIV